MEWFPFTWNGFHSYGMVSIRMVWFPFVWIGFHSYGMVSIHVMEWFPFIIYVRTYIYMHTYVHRYIYTHTHTHIHTTYIHTYIHSFAYDTYIYTHDISLRSGPWYILWMNTTCTTSRRENRHFDICIFTSICCVCGNQSYKWIKHSFVWENRF